MFLDALTTAWKTTAPAKLVAKYFPDRLVGFELILKTVFSDITKILYFFFVCHSYLQMHRPIHSIDTPHSIRFLIIF